MFLAMFCDIVKYASLQQGLKCLKLVIIKAQTSPRVNFGIEEAKTDAAKGVHTSVIQTMGKYKSDPFKHYIWKDTFFTNLY